MEWCFNLSVAQRMRRTENVSEIIEERDGSRDTCGAGFDSLIVGSTMLCGKTPMPKEYMCE